MGVNQYVQHKSGVGEKWEVASDTYNARPNQADFMVKSGVEGAGYHWLPKSEYCLCEPPEEWRDVTEDILVVSRGEYSNLVYGGEIVRVDKGLYRLRKVQLWRTDRKEQLAFVVEKKMQP